MIFFAFVDCADCVLDWTEFGECIDMIQIKHEQVISEAIGTGTPCPAEIAEESEGNLEFNFNLILQQHHPIL